MTVYRLLRNGLRVVGRSAPGAALAAVRLRLSVGSADESPAEWGIAHVVEHLVVRCAMSGGRVGDGAMVGAGTGREHTEYEVLVRAADVGAAGRVLGRVFGELRLSDAELRDELAMIRQEIAEREQDDRWRLQERLFAGLWPGTGYGRPVLGEWTALRELRADVVRRWHGEEYVPSAGTLVVASGSVDENVAELAELAADWPARSVSGRCGPPPQRKAVTASVNGPRRTVFGFAWTEVAGCQSLAGQAVRAAGGVDVQHLRLRRQVCVWLMLAGRDHDAAVAAVRTALAVTHARLLEPDGANWFATEIMLPRLRARDEVETLAKSWLADSDEVTGSVLDVAEIVDRWRLRIEEACA